MILNATGMAMTNRITCVRVIGRLGARNLGATFLSHHERLIRCPHSVQRELVR